MVIEVILGLALLSAVGKALKQNPGKKERENLRSSIKYFQEIKIDGTLTIQDIINYSFTLDGVLGLAVYDFSGSTNLFLKVAKGFEHKPVKQAVLDYVYKHTFPTPFRVNINEWEGMAKRIGNYITFEEHIKKLQIENGF